MFDLERMSRMIAARMRGAHYWLVLLVLASIIAVGAMAQFSSFRLQTYSRLAAHQYELLRTLDLVLSTLKDAETGQRGYLLTGDSTYLEPYQAALDSIGPRMAVLTDLIGHDPAMQQPLADMKSLTAEKMTELHDTIAARHAQGQSAAMTIIQSGRGKLLMDRIRHIIARIEEQEQQALDAALAEARLESRHSVLELIVWAPLALCMAALLSLFLYRGLHVANDQLHARSGGLATSPAFRYFLAPLAVGLAALLRWWIARAVGDLPPYITFYPAVLVVTMFAGPGPGIVAVILSSIVADYFFVRPIGSFAINRPSDLVALGIFAVSNLAVCLLADRLRSAAWIEHRRLRTLLDGVKGFAISMLDPTGTVTSWNGGAEALNGYAATDILGANFRVFYTREDIATGQPERDLEAARQNGQWTGERLRLRKDGSLFWAAINITAIRDPSGALIAFGKVTTDVSERTRAQNELVQANERFALSATAAELGFWDLDVGAKVLRWDDQMYKLFGRDRRPDDQPYELWSGSLHPEDRGRIERALAATIAHGSKFDSEYRIVWPDGSVRHIKVTAAVVRDAQGRAKSMYGVNFDVTERERASEQFHAALEAAPTGMLMIDEAGTIALVNAQLEAVFGYGRDELLGKPIEMLIPEQHRSPHSALRLAFFANPQNRTMAAGRELYGLRKDGSLVPIEIGLNPLHTSAGHFVLSSISDITFRERANETQQTMTALVESTSDAIVTKDLTGIIRSWNPAAEHLLGYTADEMKGQSVLRLIPADRREEEMDILARVRNGQTIDNFETIRLRKDGTSVDVSLTISPILGRAGQIVYASKIMRDITSQKRAAEALRAVNAELEVRIKTRTSELLERESMLQEIHHRVKNNLQVISSLINMQIRGLKDESSRMVLRDCQSRVMTMAQIHEMLYQSENYAQVPFDVYARDLASGILSASSISRGNVTLEFELEAVPLPVEQAIPCGLILNELVANSLKHGFPNGGRGTIRVALRFAPDHSVMLSVGDDGIGIPPALDLEHLDSLGVQLVMTLVEQLEGRLEIIRSPGSTFRIVFPSESSA